MSDLFWTTAITNVKPNELRLRGYRVDELMGKVSFGQVVYLALMGELPSNNVGKLMDAMMVSSIDHGVTPPSALAARSAASTGAPLNAAIAAGILNINKHHGGAIEGCMEVIQEGLERRDACEKSIADTAADMIDDFRTTKRRIPGLGHRIHTDDPRTKKLFAMAAELGIAGDGVAMLQALADTLESKTGKSLPINVDGAIAALLVDLKIPRELANGFFIMARVPGLMAHAYEEMTRMKPMRRIHPTDHGYDGPEDRSIEE
ncbi:MAG: citryl-CoA lyase [Anaerolineales bacterium]|nr:citryl-CoA lyase [Anaerolineales bacterium]